MRRRLERMDIRHLVELCVPHDLEALLVQLEDGGCSPVSTSQVHVAIVGSVVNDSLRYIFLQMPLSVGLHSVWQELVEVVDIGSLVVRGSQFHQFLDAVSDKGDIGVIIVAIPRVIIVCEDRAIGLELLVSPDVPQVVELLVPFERV